jgi:hypothetical protein
MAPDASLAEGLRHSAAAQERMNEEL